MKQHVYQFTVKTDNELVVISQENGTHEDGSDSIMLNPYQIDLLIKILQHAKEEFFFIPNPSVVHSK